VCKTFHDAGAVVLNIAALFLSLWKSPSWTPVLKIQKHNLINIVLQIHSEHWSSY